MTTRRLIVMRHATSSWVSGVHLDHRRPLNEIGRGEPPLIAAQLVALDWLPEVVLSSDSQRTAQTWRRMEAQFPPTPVTYKRELYHAGLEAFERAVGALDPAIRTALVLGHNPGWASVVEELGRDFMRMAPAHAALLEGAGSTWWDALAERWRLVEVLTP